MGNLAPLSQGFMDFQKGNSQDLMEFLDGFKDIPDTNIETPTVPAEDSQEPEFREQTTTVPQEIGVASNVRQPDEANFNDTRLASVDDLISPPTGTSVQNAQDLFPQDSLLQAALRRRA